MCPNLRTRLDKHILPIFGSDRLDRITVAAIEKLRNDLRDRNYAHRMINTILRIMGAVFKLGIKRGQCAKNPVDSVGARCTGSERTRVRRRLGS
jgi:hypothetical protein